jgi:(1->4)-alpha-D-glucan 1-alpha-D-glucosylmutase
LWDFNLVDPDNRRAVDFALRGAFLDRARGSDDVSTLMEQWHDGRIKLRFVADLLRLRREHPDLFAFGSYVALAATGPAGARICAFCRAREEAAIVVAAALFPLRASAEGWGDSTVPMPADAGDRWVSLFDGRRIAPCAGAIAAAELFAVLPVAVLVPEHISRAKITRPGVTGGRLYER